jgi:hypothetical protein
MSRDRGWRRYQRERIKARRKRHGHWAFHASEELLARWRWGDGISHEELPRSELLAANLAARYVDTPKPCSCYLCGNRRHLGQPTAQERRADDADGVQLDLQQKAGPTPATEDRFSPASIL